MPNWRRAHVPGGSFFFTVVTHRRAPFLTDAPARPILGSLIRVHYNPVKHGLVKSLRDWPWSSFHRWVRAGVYPENCACREDMGTMDFSDLDGTVGE